MYNASAHKKTAIAYQLDNEDYSVKVERYTFYFSSMIAKRKFERDYAKRVEWLRDSLTRRFHFHVDADWVAIFQWYMICEGRGFRVYDSAHEEFITSSDSIHFPAIEPLKV